MTSRDGILSTGPSEKLMPFDYIPFRCPGQRVDDGQEGTPIIGICQTGSPPPELLVSAALRGQRTSSAEIRVHLLDAEAKRSKI